MNRKLQSYRRFIFIGIIIIVFGIKFHTTLKDTVSRLGTVFIIARGLFLIIGMSKKRKEDKQKNKQLTHNNVLKDNAACAAARRLY